MAKLPGNQQGKYRECVVLPDLCDGLIKTKNQRHQLMQVMKITQWAHWRYLAMARGAGTPNSLAGT
jgi:hypothetical protein